MTLNELEEKLKKLTLEQFSVLLKKNYGKLLKNPKKLGFVLKIYGTKVLNESTKKPKKDEIIAELMDLDFFGKGGDLDGK